MSENKHNVLKKLLDESSAYQRFEDIEKLVEKESLAMVPVHPLYVSLLAASSDQVATIIPKLSKSQRQTMIDLDLWNRDKVDVNAFEYWIETYSKVQELEFTQEFVESENFLLYLKSRVNIYTFDSEDPQYPDHDNYFLTDDTLLLVEYDESYTYANELKFLIRNLYDRLGVEKAYALLFKLVNDSYSILEEKEYQRSKERLRDYGFVDYFEAMEKTHSFLTIGQLDKFITNKVTLTPNIEVLGKIQNLHSSALTSFKDQVGSLEMELEKINDENREQFLHFSFVRLVNSTLTLKDALREGSIELSKIGQETRKILSLGLEYIKSNSDIAISEKSLFELFDFFDLYRVGKSLIEIQRNKVLKALRPVEAYKADFLSFVGSYWEYFLTNSAASIPKVKAHGAGLQEKEVTEKEVYLFWEKEVLLFVGLMPVMISFYEKMDSLRKEGQIQDSFYLNFEASSIDFEAIMVTSLIKEVLDQKRDGNLKLGLTIKEFKLALKSLFLEANGEYILKNKTDKVLCQKLDDFIQSFGLENLLRIDDYLYGVLLDNLSGYEYGQLSDEDFKHVGGVILLAN